MSLNWDKGKAQRMSRMEEGVLIVAYLVGWVVLVAIAVSR